jgi:hypothetical protein
LCAVLIAACGSAEPDSNGYVLLDPAARQAGLSVEVNEQAVTSALPVAVSPGKRVTLVGPEENQVIEVAAGEVVHVQGGAHPTVTHLKIGKDVEAGELRVVGDEPSARQLASELGASVESAHGEWHLRSPELFSITSAAHVPEHLTGVEPVPIAIAATPAAPVAAARPVAPPMTAGVLSPSLAIAAPAPTASPAPPARVQASVPVAFTPSNACSGVAGTWRGRAFSERHGEYYDFTLRVTEGASGVKGTVSARFWGASQEEIEPPRACNGGLHAVVSEAGRGSVDDLGALHFASTSWRVSQLACGERVYGYSPDRFDMPFARGATTADAIVSDDAVWADGMPVRMTRVSCR